MIFFCISFIKLCNGKLCIILFAKTDMIAVRNGYQANLNDLKVPENEIFESVAEKQYIKGFHILYGTLWM
jgi:hypothetical protein